MRDEVYDKLLHWIMEGVLRPGEKIVDKDLAEHMGVSRTPVREALRRLEDKDLVESSANRWTRVSGISPQEPEMIYPIIWTLEKLAMSEAAGNMRLADFEKLAQANNELKAAFDKGDAVAACVADEDFHNVIIDRSLNPHLVNILQDLKIKFRRLEVVFFDGTSPYDESSIKEHERLISALKNNDTHLAEQIIHSNWEKSLKRLRVLDPRQDKDSHED